VLIGVGAEATHTAVELARQAQATGADGLVVPPPFTTRLSGDELVPYFRTVAAAVDVPVMIQDSSFYLGSALSPALVRRLAAEQPNIRYVKIEAGPEETARWVDGLAGEVALFTGDAGIHLLGCLRAGAIGNIPAVDLADRLVAVYEAERAGDRAAAEELLGALLPYLVFALQGGIDHCNAATKALLVGRGVLGRGGLRPPAPDHGPLFDELVAAHAVALDLSATPV
jgi:4-hydroxy-tetrahydrodipicolinate synthase